MDLGPGSGKTSKMLESFSLNIRFRSSDSEPESAKIKPEKWLAHDNMTKQTCMHTDAETVHRQT